jgi:hypothetical protein
MPACARPEEFWERPAIAFVRDPFDWYVSAFHHYRRHGFKDDDWAGGKLNLKGFPLFLWSALSVRSTVENPKFPMEHLLAQGYDYYSALFGWMTGKWSEAPLPEIGRFENLRGDFISFLDRHGVETPGLREAVLSYAPINTTDHESSEAFYDDLTAKLVSETPLAREFGYARSPALI